MSSEADDERRKQLRKWSIIDACLKSAGRGEEQRAIVLFRECVKRGAVRVALSAKTSPHGDTLLHLAARDGMEKLAQVLLEHGADVNAPGEGQETPLHHAARCGRVGLVQVLLMHGANVDALAQWGETPLHQVVVRAGATVMQDEAAGRHETVAVELVKRGAHLDVRNHFGLTPLELARSIGCPELAEKLLAVVSGQHANRTKAMRLARGVRRKPLAP